MEAIAHYLLEVLNGILVAGGVWILSKVIGILKPKIIQLLKQLLDIPPKKMSLLLSPIGKM